MQPVIRGKPCDGVEWKVVEPRGCDCVTPGWALYALGSFHTAVGKPSVAGKAGCPVGPKSPNQRLRSRHDAGGRVVRRCPCAAPPPRSQRHADWLARRLPGHVPERPGAPGCGRRGMDPQAASGRGPGEPSSQKASSAEVSATGWGTRAPASTRAGSRGARAPRRGRSPGKRRGRASARRAWPLTAVGTGARGPEPQAVAGAGGKGHRGCSGAECGSECEERGVGCRERVPAAGDWVRWERRGNGFFFFFFFLTLRTSGRC